jgi:uncharacterized protein YbjT (DUF2867 family)
MAAAKEIIAVVGATGAQGGGLARAILADRESRFAVRAITRDPGSPQARELAALGAEVVAADLHDPPSIARAFEGAYGGYLVTFFWAHFSPEKEQAEARNLAEAAKHAGLQHVIWSTLEDTRRWVPLADDRIPTLMGHYKVPHFDAKGDSDRFFAELALPTTYFLTSFYWDNLIHFGLGPKRGADGKLAFTLPMADRNIPGIAAEDIGKCAYGIFCRGNEFVGKRIGVAGEHLTGMQMAAELSAALGEPVAYNAVTPAQFRQFGFPGADDLGNMFQFMQEFEDDFCNARSPAGARELNPALLGFREWLALNKDRIPLA